MGVPNLQSSGAISLNDVNLHLSRASGSYIEMNDLHLRQLAAGFGTAGVGNPFPMSYFYGANRARLSEPTYPHNLYFRTRDNGYDGNWSGETHWSPVGWYNSDSLDYSLNFNPGLYYTWNVISDLSVTVRFRKALATAQNLSVAQIVVYFARSDLSVVSNAGVAIPGYITSDSSYEYYEAQAFQSLAAWGTNLQEITRSDGIVSIYVNAYCSSAGYIFYIGGGADLKASLSTEIT